MDEQEARIQFLERGVRRPEPAMFDHHWPGHSFWGETHQRECSFKQYHEEAVATGYQGLAGLSQSPLDFCWSQGSFNEK
jgi:hypothetical protein